MASENYAYEKIENFIGILINIIPKYKNYSSTALFTNSQKKISGIDLVLNIEQKINNFYFPIEISNFNLGKILNQKVRFSKKEWSSPTEGTLQTYILEILSGDLVDKRLEKEVFV